MDEEPIVDIAKACRLCLMNENDPDMLDMNQDILKTIQICSIKIFESNDFPARICTNCHSILQFILKFHKMCENTVTYLHETYLHEESIEMITKQDPDEDIDDTLSENTAEIITNDDIQEEILTETETPDAQDEEIVRDQLQADDAEIENEEYIFEVNNDVHDQEQTVDKIEIDHIEYERIESAHEYEESKDQLWVEGSRKQEEEEDELTVYILDHNNQIEQQNKESQILLRSKSSHLNLKHKIVDATSKVFSCEICGNTYRKMGALESHRRRHRNSKPYECEICSQTFDYNFKLERHMRKHTGSKPFTCEYCDRRFFDRSTMSRHQKIHRNERAYACTMCGKSFTYYSVLKTHIMSHTGEKPYACGICDKGFHRASDLKNHLETLQHRKDPRVPELLQNIRRKEEVTLHGFT